MHLEVRAFMRSCIPADRRRVWVRALQLPLLAFLLVMAAAPVRAQQYESVGIRAQGMAGAFVAVADDATASWWNPAGLATSLSFADVIVEAGDGGHWGIALGFPSLGLSYYRLNIR